MLKSNNLIKEKSPYLLQHAKNPVNWYPWCDEAFDKAIKEDKPIFLSIGYSTCHWCHVMAHESFEDPDIAELMNKFFISIKVDREERPDIDKIYMLVCQMLTGSGGWPLTILMTPEKKPFFAGTYFPKETKYGRIGLIDLIKRIKIIWNSQRDDIYMSSDKISDALQNFLDKGSEDKISRKILINAYNQLKDRFDIKKGGFGLAPKFPTSQNLLFLLRYWKRTREKTALKMVEKTLKEMSMGGIYDHIGFGFHRYSTDQNWLVPHFEKMLYDQAMISLAYLETYQLTKNKEYAKIARQIFTYVLRDLISPEGGFYSAEDADSEGVEGKYYVWSKEELDQILEKEDIKILTEVYNIGDIGNYFEESNRKKNGKNILHLEKSLKAISKKLNINTKEFKIKIENIRKKLFSIRNTRIKPFKDDKILTDWNGLIIAALAKGGIILNDPRYIKAARKAAGFIMNYLYKPNNRLLHRYRDDNAEINAYIDDYAFFIWGLIELYEVTFDVYYLDIAIELNNELLDYFWDEINGGFYFTANDGEILILKQKEIYDGAIPSGNSIAMINLLRLSYLTGNQVLQDKAELMGNLFVDKIKNNPLAYMQFLIAIDFLLGPTYSIVIAGDSDSKDTELMLRFISNNFLPNKTIIYRPTNENSPMIDKYVQFIKYFDKINDKATAYICFNKICKPPTNDYNTILRYVKSNWEN